MRNKEMRLECLRMAKDFFANEKDLSVVIDAAILLYEFCHLGTSSFHKRKKKQK